MFDLQFVANIHYRAYLNSQLLLQLLRDDYHLLLSVQNNSTHAPFLALLILSHRDLSGYNAYGCWTNQIVVRITLRLIVLCTCAMTGHIFIFFLLHLHSHNTERWLYIESENQSLNLS